MKWGKVVTILLSGVAGTSAALVTVTLSAEQRAEPARVAELSEPPEPSVQPRAQDSRVADLGRRVSALEQLEVTASEPSPKETEPEREAPEYPPGFRTAEEERATLARQYAETLRDFQAEELDPDWAAGAVELIDVGMEKALDGFDATMTGLECRSETCLFELQGEPGVELEMAANRALTTNFGLGCARTMTKLENPERIGFVLDCP